MITTYEEYRKNYLDLLVNGVIPADKEKMVNPNSEPKFIINANTRTITIPEVFQKGVAVYKDYKSETLFFEIDRYFDDVDFSDKKCCVQIINAEQQQTALPINYKYLSEDNTKIILGWTLTQEVSVKEGQVTFSIRFFSLDDEQKTLTYNWSTLPTTINIYKGLYILEGAATIPSKTTLELLLDQISNLWANGQPTYDYNSLLNRPKIDDAYIEGDIGPLIRTIVNGEGSSNKFLTIDDVLQELLVPSLSNGKGNYPVSNDALYDKFETVDSGLSDLEFQLTEINEKIANVSYIPINIESFTIEPLNLVGTISGNTALVENGSNVKKITFYWKLSKAPNSLQIGEDSIPAPKETGNFTKEFSTPLTSNQTFALKASEKNQSFTEEAKLVFCNNIFWGARTKRSLDDIDSNFIRDDLMSRELSTSRQKIINVNINKSNNENRYLYIAIPVDLGTPRFFIGSVEGGFDFLKTESIIGYNDYSTNYNIYRSTNPNLGNIEITIK